MTIRLLALTCIAALALPATAQARTTRAELRHDVRVVHQQKHQLARAVHNGNAKRAKVERRELRFARQELREDRRDFAKQRRRHNHPG